MVWYGMVWYRFVWYGVVCGMIPVYYIVWYGMVHDTLVYCMVYHAILIRAGLNTEVLLVFFSRCLPLLLTNLSAVSLIQFSRSYEHKLTQPETENVTCQVVYVAAYCVLSSPEVLLQDSHGLIIQHSSALLIL